MIEAGLSTLLTATLSGVPVYPVLVPENPTYPCVSYQVVSASTEHSMELRQINQKRIQFDVWALTYGQCKQIEETIGGLLDGFVGSLPDGTRVVGSFSGIVMDYYESDSRTYRTTAEYSIQYV